MSRFFSPANLGRYRRIADKMTNSTERNQVLRTLADEWDVFTGECRATKPTASI